MLPKENQIAFASNFEELALTPFQGDVNAICWSRDLIGDFSEIVNQVDLVEDMIVLSSERLQDLQLSPHGQFAREILLNDFNLLKAHGASPILNVIKCYEKDDAFPFFPTDVYSFHVDRSPIATDTFLCTYHGEPSEIVPNAHARQKVQIPEIRAELKKLYDGLEEGFDEFLAEYFFDLHYQAESNAHLINLGQGNLWKLAVDHPGSKVLPCLHRAPIEKLGEKRLLMIC